MTGELGVPDEADDSAALRQFVRRQAVATPAVIETIDVQTPTLRLHLHPGDTVTIDYGIEMYRDNGEKDGEFRMSHQLFTYGPPNFRLDAAMEDVIVPSGKDSYSRVNPVCGSPVVVIRNLGEQPLHKLTINYGLKGGPRSEYLWTGKLGFLEKEAVSLPAPDWMGFDGPLVFEVTLSKPNGKDDERPHNNHMVSTVVAPEVLPAEFVLSLEPNDLGRDRDNAYTISDACGAVLMERADFTPLAGYSDDLGALTAALLTLSHYIDDEVKEKTRRRLQQWFGPAAAQKRD